MTLISLAIASVALAAILWSRAYWCAAGVACWIISVGAFNLWTLVLPIAPQEYGEIPAGYLAYVDHMIDGWRWWSFGLNAVVVLYSGVCFVMMTRITNTEFTKFAMDGGEHGVSVEADGRLISQRGDLLGSLTFGILFLTEAYALLFENLVCNWNDLMGSVLVVVWGANGASAVCARTVGEWSVWLPTVLTMLVFCWVATLAVRQRLYLIR